MDKTLDCELAQIVEARYKPEYREIPAFQIVTNAAWTLSRAIRGLDAQLTALDARLSEIETDRRHEAYAKGEEGYYEL